MSTNQILLSSQEMHTEIERLAALLLRNHPDTSNLALIGIQRRGVNIAARLGAMMEKKINKPILHGSLDIALYRDDWTTKGPKPAVRQTNIPFEVDGKDLVLVDDVLYTGRTVRAALEALTDFGRPNKVELLVLVDRGHRELPIHADYIGRTITTKRNDRVDVLVQERDGCDEVRLVTAT